MVPLVLTHCHHENLAFAEGALWWITGFGQGAVVTSTGAFFNRWCDRAASIPQVHVGCGMRVMKFLRGKKRRTGQSDAPIFDPQPSGDWSR